MMRMMTMTPYHRVRVTLHTDYLGSKIWHINGLGIGGGGIHTPSTLMNRITPPPPAHQRRPSSNSLIWLTLDKKTMGVVFEFMEDLQHPSQQHWQSEDLWLATYWCCCPLRYVGDELLSLNNNSMSWLTIDELMDLSSWMPMLKMWIFCFVGRRRIGMHLGGKGIVIGISLLWR